MPARRRTTLSAMTLLEVVIAIALIAMLMGALLTFMFQTLKIREEAGLVSAETQLIKNLFDRMEGELRRCVALESVGFPDMVQFVGDRRSISFLTSPLPTRENYRFFTAAEESSRVVPRHDLVQVSYQLWIDDQERTEEGDPLVAGILRTEQLALEPAIDEGAVALEEEQKNVRHDLWAHEIGYLEFRYFDGVEWTTTWAVSEGNRLPHLVQITLGFNNLTREEYDDRDLEQYLIDEYPLGPDQTSQRRYSKIVRIPAADEMFSARLNRLQQGVEEVYETGVPAEEEEFDGEGTL